MSKKPYVGLRPFNQEDHLFFFGRRKQVTALLQGLHDTRFLAVVGGSGSGKSSLVRAGLLPALDAGYLLNHRDRWQFIICKPGDDPMGNLARAVDAATGLEIEQTGGGNAAAVAAKLNAAFPENDTNVLLLVDQFEELFTLEKDRRACEFFVENLLALSRQTDFPVYLCLTMRSDFLGLCDRFQGLPEAFNQGQFLVPRLTRAQLREAVVGPASLFGAQFTPRLLDRLLNRIVHTTDELPVLQHLLSRMWQPDTKLLDLAAYDEAGGLEHALANHAEEALTGLSDADRHLVAQCFQGLTETDAANRMVRRPTHLKTLAAVTGADATHLRKLLGRFVGSDRSFLFLSSSEDADPLIDISHESLIRRWPTLRTWVEEEAVDARRYRRLADDARGWEKETAGHWREPRLSQGLELLARKNKVWAMRYDEDFQKATNFLEQSRLADERERAEREALRRRQTMLGWALAVIMLLAALVSFIYARQARLAEEKAEVRLAESQWAVAVANKQTGDSLKANHYFARAAMTHSSFVHGSQFELQTKWTKEIVLDVTGKVWGSVNGTLMLPNDLVLTFSNNGKARLWRLDGTPSSPNMTHNASISGAKYLVSERVLLIWDSKGTVRLWGLDGTPASRPMKHKDSVLGASYLEAAGKLLTWSEDRTARLWDLDGTPATPHLKHNKSVLGAIFLESTEKILTWSLDGTARLWDLDGFPCAIPIRHEGGVRGATYLRTLGKLLTWGEDGISRVWGLDGLPDSHPMEHRKRLRGASFLESLELVLTWGNDGMARLWTLGGVPVSLPMIHEDTVWGASYLESEKKLLTWSWDGTVRIWELSGKPLGLPMRHEDIVRGASYLDGPGKLLTWSNDKTARLWWLDGTPASPPMKHEGAVNGVNFLEGQDKILTWSEDRTVRLWNLVARRGSPAPSLQGVFITSRTRREY
ncbi:MAG: WD40 repeat domain-containing protein [Acidobacteriota bacterium]|nr:WD40 repeat domain-containing protein [Acidobacteriota bacterium]